MSESHELVEPVELVNPMTGEIVKPDEIDKIVQVVRDLKAHQDEVRSAQAAFGSILVEYSKTVGKRTLVAGGVKFEVSAADEIEWDIDKLAELRELGLPEARYDELVYANIGRRRTATSPGSSPARARSTSG